MPLAILGLLLTAGAVTVADQTHASAPPPAASAPTDSSSYIYYNGTVVGNGGVQTVFVPAPANGTVWDLVSARISITAGNAVGTTQMSYLYDSTCTQTPVAPAPSACKQIYGPNVDAIANDILEPGKVGTVVGGGGYTSAKPSGVSYWIQFEQTVHLNHDMFISFGAELSTGVSSTYYLVFDPEVGDYPSFAFYRWGDPVDPLSSTAKTVTIPGPPTGYYYRAEISVSTIQLATLPGPTRSAEVVEEPSGTVLSFIDDWTVDATGLTEDACGGYSAAQTCTSDPTGTATVWYDQVLVTSSESLEARFVGVSGDLGVFGVVVTEYPAVPAAPTALSAASPTTSSLTWSWTNPGGPLTDDLFFWAAGSSCASSTEVNLEGVTDSYLLSSLSAGTEYCAYVEAVSAGGTSPHSSTATGTTTPSSAPGAPTNASAAPEGVSEILVSWTNPSGPLTDDLLDQYSGSSCLGPPTTVDVGSVVSSFDATQLEADTTYSFEVAAANSVGDGAWSNCANATTDLAPPPAPTNLSATAVSSSSIELLWTNPPGALGDDYVYTYVGSGCSGVGATADLGSVEDSYLSAGLAANSTYSYEVEASNPAGAGPNSNCSSSTTESGGGGGPENVTVLELTAITPNATAASGVAAQVEFERLSQNFTVLLGPTNASGNVSYGEFPAGALILNVTLVGGNFSLNSYSVTNPGSSLQELLLIVTPVPPTANNTTTVHWVEFDEQGLPLGATWWVSVAGPISERFNSSGTAIRFELQNGTYQFTVGADTDLNASEPQGTIVVPDAPTKLSVNFTSQSGATSGPPPSTSVAPPTSIAFGVTGAVVLALLAVAGSLVVGFYVSARRHPTQLLRHAPRARLEVLRHGDFEAMERLERTIRILQTLDPGTSTLGRHGLRLPERYRTLSRWVRGRYSRGAEWLRARRK